MSELLRRIHEEFPGFEAFSLDMSQGGFHTDWFPLGKIPLRRDSLRITIIPGVFVKEGFIEHLMRGGSFDEYLRGSLDCMVSGVKDGLLVILNEDEEAEYTPESVPQLFIGDVAESEGSKVVSAPVEKIIEVLKTLQDTGLEGYLADCSRTELRGRKRLQRDAQIVAEFFERDRLYIDAKEFFRNAPLSLDIQALSPHDFSVYGQQLILEEMRKTTGSPDVSMRLAQFFGGYGVFESRAEFKDRTHEVAADLSMKRFRLGEDFYENVRDEMYQLGGPSFMEKLIQQIQIIGKGQDHFLSADLVFSDCRSRYSKGLVKKRFLHEEVALNVAPALLHDTKFLEATIKHQLEVVKEGLFDDDVSGTYTDCFPVQGSDRSYFLKRLNIRRVRGADHELVSASQIRDKGLYVPEGLGLVVIGSLPYLVFEHVSNAIDLSGIYGENEEERRRLNAAKQEHEPEIYRLLGGYVQNMFDCGVRDEDMALRNFMVEFGRGVERVFMVDFEKTTIQKGGLSELQRARTLEQFFELNVLSDERRGYFLEGYSQM
ncbi:hypothetical protein CMO92_02605 [Candidatus Woesearchaeota archaeon]|nr:hypothetical protein [Candidatus Woesearchaeota archaeon]|tara:strand:- start:24 stop:1652 length:1629 start_codon:yes stop_codon:yes gene_type:complete